MALPTTPSGVFEPALGSRVKPGLARDDPRWARLLPWTSGIAGSIGPPALLALGGLVLVNVVVPLAILHRTARRRPWSLRLLMALPVAVAVPLTALLTPEPLIPARLDPWPSSAKLLFTLGTVVGLPVVVFVALIGGSVIHKRRVRFAVLVGLIALASVAVGTLWLWADMQVMPTIERYDWTGWYRVAMPGAYVVGLVLLIGWALRGAARFTIRLGLRDLARPA
jgi:hypothetical protein